MRLKRLTAAALTFLTPLMACARVADEEAKVRTLTAPFVEGGWVRGVVVGVVDADGPRVYGFGKLTNDPSAKAPDENTVFEIASVTKTFTATALAEMTGRGDVKL